MYINSKGELIHPDNKLEPVLGIYSLVRGADSVSMGCTLLANMHIIDDYLFFSTQLPF